MKYIIGKDIRIKNPNQDVINFCKKELTIDNPDYISAQRMGRYLGNIEKKIKLYSKNGDELILPFGCLKRIWKINPKTDFELVFHSEIKSFMEGCINLYPYQEKAKNSLILGKNGILEAPCGSGKTQIGLQLIKELGRKALWLTHTKKLLTQSKERCEKYFKGDFGTITEGFVNIGKDITFATVQTMSKLDPSIYRDAFDVVIVDECHHCVGSPTKVMQFYKILTNLNCRHKYGLTATLTRQDGMIASLYAIIGDKLHTIDKKEVGDKIIKADYVPIEIDIDYDKYEYLEFDGTINHNNLINCLSFNSERNQIIVDKVFEVYNSGKHKQLILTHRVKQVQDLAEMIRSFCTVSEIYGSVKQSERDYDGEVIIATYQLAKEGLDIPELDILHLATPQKNEITTKQSIGRIERNIDGKNKPVCYDYVDMKVDYCVACFKKRKKIQKK